MGEGQSAGAGGALGWGRVTGLSRLVTAPSVILQTAIECPPFARPWAWWVETPVPPGTSRFSRREVCEDAVHAAPWPPVSLADIIQEVGVGGGLGSDSM